MATVAFIGLGNMGGPMAANLAKAGHTVQAFDLVQDALDKLETAGGKACASASDAVKGADCVISMLPAGKHVDNLYLNEKDGLLKQVDKSAIILDCSTIDVATANKVGNAAKALGIQFLDTPVSGGVAAAAAGTLTFMCGGDAAGFERAKLILADMGKAIFHAGDHGAGQAAKMCNNMLLAIHMVGTAEALQMGVNNGLDPKVLSEIMLASSGRNWSLEVYNPHPGVMETAPASNDYQPGFMVQLMLKDLGLAMENSVATHSSVPMGALARSLYASHQRSGANNAMRDFSSIAEMFADQL